VNAAVINNQSRRGRPALPVQPISAAQDPDALLTVDTVATLSGFKAATIREWSREGRFPKPIHMGRMVRWRAGEVRAWLQRYGGEATLQQSSASAHAPPTP
jgi:predicted DNA-binding transcriptional regulator AlpA